MKKILGLIVIAVAVCAIASLLARSRRTDDGEEQAVEDIGTLTDQEDVLMPEDNAAAETEAETEAETVSESA